MCSSLRRGVVTLVERVARPRCVVVLLLHFPFVLYGALNRFNYALHSHKVLVQFAAVPPEGSAKATATSRRAFTIWALAAINFVMC